MWRGGYLRYDFVVRPGAEVSRIGFELEGVEWSEVRGDRIRLGTSLGEVEIGGLCAYQGGKRGEVASWFRGEEGRHEIGIGPYDRSRMLVIDPLVYSTYLGGAGTQEAGRDIAVDGSGQAWVTGGTNSTDYDTTSGAFQTINGGGYAVFVTKIGLVSAGVGVGSGGMVVYSNPSAGPFVVECERGGLFELRDGSRKVLRRYELVRGPLTIDESLPARVYCLREVGTGAVQKIVISP